MAKRRSGSLPSKLELQKRTAALGSRRAERKFSTVAAKDAQELLEAAEFGSMSLEALQKRCDELVEEESPMAKELMQPPQSAPPQSAPPAANADASGAASLLDGTYDEAEPDTAMAEPDTVSDVSDSDASNDEDGWSCDEDCGEVAYE